MEITSFLQHSLQSRSEWKGVGQSANHTCCKRHQNVELQFITVQAMQEDDDGNALTIVKPDVAAVLRAKREFQPGEFMRYQYTDQSEHLKKIFECECCFHVGLCQPHKNRRRRLAMEGQQHQDCHRHLGNDQVWKQRNDSGWELVCVWCELCLHVFAATWFLWWHGSQAYNKLVSRLTRHPQSREDDEWRGTDGSEENDFSECLASN